MPAGMHMRHSGSSPATNCKMACTLLKAPIQVSPQDGAGLAVPQVAALAIHLPELATLRSAASAPPLVQDTSPPPLRFLLCTFLI